MVFGANNYRRWCYRFTGKDGYNIRLYLGLCLAGCPGHHRFIVYTGQVLAPPPLVVVLWPSLDVDDRDKDKKE